MTDIEKWNSTTDKTLYGIAKKWAKKYTMKQLRAFQKFYTETMGEGCKDGAAMMKRWQCVTWAIDIKAFGK